MNEARYEPLTPTGARRSDHPQMQWRLQLDTEGMKCASRRGGLPMSLKGQDRTCTGGAVSGRLLWEPAHLGEHTARRRFKLGSAKFVAAVGANNGTKGILLRIKSVRQLERVLAALWAGDAHCFLRHLEVLPFAAIALPRRTDARPTAECAAGYSHRAR